MGHILYIPKPIFGFYPVKYGLLYNWWAATDVRNISAIGWHVPTNTEITTLQTYIGGIAQGGKLREVNLLYWSSISGATNEFGFNGRGSGVRGGSNALFSVIKSQLHLWSSTSQSTTTARHGRLDVGNSFVISFTGLKTEGKSIRLIKDSTTLTHGQTGIYAGNDGKIYRTICIGTREYLADNLVETKYRNGDWITGFDGGVYTPITNANWAAKTTEACCAYNDDLNNI